MLIKNFQMYEKTLKNTWEHSTQMMSDSLGHFWIPFYQFFDRVVPEGFHEMVFANSFVHCTSKP